MSARREPFTAGETYEALQWMAEQSRAGSLRAFQELVRIEMRYENGLLSDEERAAYERFRAISSSEETH